LAIEVMAGRIDYIVYLIIIFMNETVKTNETKKGITQLYPYWFALKVNNRLGFAKIALQLFNLKQQQIGSSRILQNRHIELMAYFLVYGFSEETRKNFLNIGHYKSSSIKQLCSYLISAGYIVQDEKNLKLYRLSKVMNDLSNFVHKQVPHGAIKSFGFLVEDKG
jgi:hypothetical protein